MESDHFDALTARLAAPLSRRRGLGLLGLLGLSGVAARDETDAKKRKKRKGNKRKTPTSTLPPVCTRQCGTRTCGDDGCGGSCGGCGECQTCLNGVCAGKANGIACATGTCQGGRCACSADANCPVSCTCVVPNDGGPKLCVTRPANSPTALSCAACPPGTVRCFNVPGSSYCQQACPA